MATLVRDDALPDVVMPIWKVRQVMKGQQALVTGASSGISKAVALAQGEAGADVVVNYYKRISEPEDIGRAVTLYPGFATGG